MISRDSIGREAVQVQQIDHLLRSGIGVHPRGVAAQQDLGRLSYPPIGSGRLNQDIHRRLVDRSLKLAKSKGSGGRHHHEQNDDPAAPSENPDIVL